MKGIEGGVLLLSDDSLEALQAQLAAVAFDGPLFDDDPKGRRLSEALQTAGADFDPQTVPFGSRRHLLGRVFQAPNAGRAGDDGQREVGLSASAGRFIDRPASDASQGQSRHMYPGQGVNTSA